MDIQAFSFFLGLFAFPVLTFLVIFLFFAIERFLFLCFAARDFLSMYSSEHGSAGTSTRAQAEYMNKH